MASMEWLVNHDPAIRWQVLRDLADGAADEVAGRATTKHSEPSATASSAPPRLPRHHTTYNQHTAWAHRQTTPITRQLANNDCLVHVAVGVQLHI